MVKTTSIKSWVKASAYKPSGKPPPKDKTLGLEQAIRFYMLKDDDDTAEGEET